MADGKEMIGPSFPPCHSTFTRSENADNTERQEYITKPLLEGDANCTNLGLPPSLDLRPKRDHIPSSIKHEDQQILVLGPKLPPELKGRGNNVSIGPKMPPEWSKDTCGEIEEEDDSCIGPLPNFSNTSDEHLRLKNEIESRSRAMKDNLLGRGRKSPPKRESWMIELPPEMSANIGIVPRTFKKTALNSSDSDRSVWTEIPAYKGKKPRDEVVKQYQANYSMKPAQGRRDTEMNKRIEEHNTQHRSVSLLEIHQAKRKKKKSDDTSNRRPFERSRDMDVKEVDTKAAEKIIKSANSMSSKFQNSKFQSKFL